jgi:hypothetical protein
MRCWLPSEATVMRACFAGFTPVVCGRTRIISTRFKQIDNALAIDWIER